MNAQARYESIIKVQKQLLAFASVQPSWHFKLHGSKDINEALQTVKKLLADATLELLSVEEQGLDFYLDNCDNSLSLHNL